MKRIFLAPLAAAALSIAMLPVHAQSTANPGAKVDPKNNKVGKPVVEKPKVKLMTRDELRSCMITQRGNDAEGKAIKVEEAEYNAAHKALLDDKATLTKRGEELAANLVKLKTEREDIMKLGETAAKPDPKLEKDEVAKLRADYTARAAAFDPRLNEHNKNKDAYLADSKAFDTRVEAHNKRREALQERAEKLLDANDDWKQNCANKSYDEVDEIAVKKELAAQGK